MRSYKVSLPLWARFVPDDADRWLRFVLTAARSIPNNGKNWIMRDGRQYGRNALIAEEIFRLTGQQRTRQQISSHIQVLKKVHADDTASMYFISRRWISTELISISDADLEWTARGRIVKSGPGGGTDFSASEPSWVECQLAVGGQDGRPRQLDQSSSDVCE